MSLHRYIYSASLNLLRISITPRLHALTLSASPRALELSIPQCRHVDTPTARLQIFRPKYLQCVAMPAACLQAFMSPSLQVLTPRSGPRVLQKTVLYLHVCTLATRRSRSDIHTFTSAHLQRAPELKVLYLYVSTSAHLQRASRAPGLHAPIPPRFSTGLQEFYVPIFPHITTLTARLQSSMPQSPRIATLAACTQTSRPLYHLAATSEARRLQAPYLHFSIPPYRCTCSAPPDL